MKLPFNFDLKFVFRLLLPGFVLAFSFLPILQLVIGNLSIKTSLELPFIACVIFFGWVFIILDMQIYMFFEGRRYWPKAFKSLMIDTEKKRLQKLIEANQKYKVENYYKYLETSVELRRFPIDEKTGEYYVVYPTKLGNLIASYESYPDRIYGMDSSFFWYRLFLTIDDEHRDYIDGQQALPDSILYVSLAMFVSGLLFLFYGIIKLWQIEFFANLPSGNLLILFSSICFFAGYLLYKISLHVHATFGEIFKSYFDVFRDNISDSLDGIIDEISKIKNEPALIRKPYKQKNRIVWRFLHNYKIKNDDGTVVSVSKFIYPDN
ncbi:MAG: hypothetical protein KAI26_09765 [Nanoarchaeota archaeon]|nr:hypothetical protein [Nanoarchaeota archaeon]